MWHIGQRVVCIDDVFDERFVRIADGLPIKGMVYTIRTIREIDGEIGFLLHEIKNKEFQFLNAYGEQGFLSKRFKPLDEKRIDIFRAMLKSKEKEKVE